jgi:hypothetical protein
MLDTRTGEMPFVRNQTRLESKKGQPTERKPVYILTVRPRDLPATPPVSKRLADCQVVLPIGNLGLCCTEIDGSEVRVHGHEAGDRNEQVVERVLD